ncbi:AsmA-like C-terminal region-containing protein [Gammaproteobacteria bacterium]|nr:AsmA-like C-terminal region-containing protein [Gammaproteobacteria bacterium]
MSALNSFIKSIAILVTFIFIVIGSVYILIITKPESVIFVTNKLLNEDYSMEFKEAKSNTNFLSPIVVLSDVSIRETNQKEIFKADEIKIGVKIIKSILDGHIHLNTLSLINIDFLNESNSQGNNGTYKLKINNIYISTKEFTFSSNETQILSKVGDLSISNKFGEINNIPFTDLKIYKKDDSNQYLYSAFLELDEKIIENEDLINLNEFSDKNINLKVYSKGHLDSKKNEISALNKYIFKDSYIVTGTKYEVKKIDAVLYSNINQKLSGIFSAKIPDQMINGSISVFDNKLILRSDVSIKMDNFVNFGDYLNLSGTETFNAKLSIDNNASLELSSNLSNTTFSSYIDELNKRPSDNLKTKILISDLSQPTYEIENNKFSAYINNNNGYFSLGSSFDEDIKKLNFIDGFYIFLELDDLKIGNLVVENQLNDESNLKLIKLKIKQLDFFNNIYFDQIFEINFSGDETESYFYGNNLNGTLRIDSSGFTRIDIFDTKFEFKGVNIFDSTDAFKLNDVNLRFVGKNIQTFDDVFQNIDFYFLKNKTVTTIDNIKISSKNFNIGPSFKNEKAYISYNNQNDLYKIRGSFEFDNQKDLLGKLINYDFDYLFSDLNIQWISATQLKNLEGRIRFKIKDFESNTSLPDSALLNAVKVFNLNALVSSLGDETSFNSSKLIISRAEGDFYIGQNRALLTKPIKLETSEAKMSWTGEILKNNNGLMDQLDLSLEMRLKVSENIPWYAAVFGGIPALAGGFVLENIIDERVDDASTFKFNITGSIDDPKIIRLN